VRKRTELTLDPELPPLIHARTNSSHARRVRNGVVGIQLPNAPHAGIARLSTASAIRFVGRLLSCVGNFSGCDASGREANWTAMLVTSFFVELTATQAGKVARAVDALIAVHGGRERAAAALKISHETIRTLSAGRSGRRHPRTLDRIARGAGCSREELLAGLHGLARCRVNQAKVDPAPAAALRCAA